MLMDTKDSLTQQLEDMYAQKDLLNQELGVSDAEDLIGMFRNLETQLCDLYETYGGLTDLGSGSASLLLNQVEKMSEQLDSFYNEKELVLTIENDKPVMKAIWKKSHNAQGAH